MAADGAQARSGPAQARPVALEIEEITAPEALDALAPEWRALFDADPQASPFQAPEWLLPWRRAFLPGGGLWTMALRRDGVLAGLAPFYLHERQLTLLGNGTSDRNALLARPEARAAVASAVGRRLVERAELWDRADFRDLPDGSPLLGLALGRGRERVEPEEPCPALDLPSEPQALLARLPKSRRADLRRCARRLAEIAPHSFTRADAASLDEHLDALVALHGARWRTRGQAGALATAATLAFHRDAASGLLAQGLLQLDALRLGERIIAVHYGLRRHATAASYLHAFDPEFQAFGPGWLLLAECLKRAIADGVSRVDFLRGREPYKYDWGATDQPQWRRRFWRRAKGNPTRA